MKPRDPCKICIVKPICQIPKEIQRNPFIAKRCQDYESFKIRLNMYQYTKRPEYVDEEWLDYGRKFDEQRRLVDELFVSEVFRNFKYKKYQNLELYREALSSVLANLVVCARDYLPLSKPQVVHHRNRYSWFTDLITGNILNELVRLGYCKHWTGYHGLKSGRTAKYCFNWNMVYRKLDVKLVRTDNLIRMKKRLRKKKGEYKAKQVYTEPPKIRKYYKMYEQVEKINNLLEKETVKFVCDFSVYSNPVYEESLKSLVRTGYLFKNKNEYEINKADLAVYRVFNRNDYRYGGRFYTKIFGQIPSEIRNTITIDGEPTVELDYSAHHIRMLYNYYLDLDFSGEAYVYSKSDKVNADKRNLLKYVSLIAINASSRTGTVWETKKKIREDIKLGKFKSKLPTIKEIDDLYEQFLNYHHPISKYVSADVGILMMQKDSEIMNNILLDLTSRNIVALPYHDSIVVQSKYSEILKQTMIKTYKEEMNNHEPKIK